jgi:hypothetical protein
MGPTWEWGLERRRRRPNALPQGPTGQRLWLEPVPLQRRPPPGEPPEQGHAGDFPPLR